jgi:hypothetical protein
MKKKIPATKRSYIKRINANTAFTTACNTTNEIVIFRYEEWFKVFIHETMHALGLDFSEINTEYTNQCIMDIMPVKSDVRLYETYCETWASILNAMFISLFSTNHNEDLENMDRMIKKTQNFIHLEILFSLFQCCKVLSFFDLKYTDLSEQSINAHNKRTNQYKEETQILSYYILKPISLFHIDALV